MAQIYINILGPLDASSIIDETQFYALSLNTPEEINKWWAFIVDDDIFNAFIKVRTEYAVKREEFKRAALRVMANINDESNGL